MKNEDAIIDFFAEILSTKSGRDKMKTALSRAMRDKYDSSNLAYEEELLNKNIFNATDKDSVYSEMNVSTIIHNLRSVRVINPYRLGKVLSSNDFSKRVLNGSTHYKLKKIIPITEKKEEVSANKFIPIVGVNVVFEPEQTKQYSLSSSKILKLLNYKRTNDNLAALEEALDDAKFIKNKKGKYYVSRLIERGTKDSRIFVHEYEVKYKPEN